MKIFMGLEYRRFVSLPQPWCCTVYFAVDNSHNLYWISTPDRRHSQEIAQNPKVAGAVVLPHAPGDKVRGVQFQGLAREVGGDEFKELFQAYEERFSRPGLAEEIRSGNNPHHLYQIKPELFVLFDELNFPGDARQEWRMATTKEQT
jgi:uncharacterized protein YhbP (UPF0306 family)